MLKKNSLSVVVTAFNEENSIRKCLLDLSSMLSESVEDYEIIFVNDGSTDKTLDEAISVQKNNSKIQIINNLKNKGTGKSIEIALNAVSLKKYCWFPSDLEIPVSELKKAIQYIDHYSIVITYLNNSNQIRSAFRNLLSIAFTWTINFSFNFKSIKYFNGVTIFDVSLIKNKKIISKRFFIHAELLIYALMQSKNFIQIPINIMPRDTGKSKAIKINALVDVIVSFVRTFFSTRIHNLLRL